jgi:hypothetical protein
MKIDERDVVGKGAQLLQRRSAVIDEVDLVPSLRQQQLQEIARYGAVFGDEDAPPWRGDVLLVSHKRRALGLNFCVCSHESGAADAARDPLLWVEIVNLNLTKE